MNIIFDGIIFSLQSAGGISKVFFEIFKRFNNSNDTKLYLYKLSNNNLYFNLTNQIDNIRIISKHLSPLFVRFLPSINFNIKYSTIFHSTYYRIGVGRKIINVTTVHDFTNEFYGTGLRKRLNSLQKFIAIYFSKGIICVSQNTKKDLLSFYPWVKNKEIRVIYNGLDDGYRANYNSKILEELFTNYKNIPENFILYVGSRAKYKNFNLVLKTMRKLNNFSLVVVGGGNLSLDDENELNFNLYHLKKVTDEQLNVLYSYANCLVYPSNYEGFGIPLLEAMRTGCPVVTTNKSSIPEVCGDAAIYLNELKADSLKQIIISLLDKGKRRDVIKKGIIQSNKFSWNSTYHETINFYSFLLNNNK